MNKSPAPNYGLPIATICAAALAGYIFLGRELKFMLDSVPYHRQLVGMILQGQSLSTWLRQVFAQPLAAPNGEAMLTVNVPVEWN